MIALSDLTADAWTRVAERAYGPLGEEHWRWCFADRDALLMARATGRVLTAHRHLDDGIELLARVAR